MHFASTAAPTLTPLGVRLLNVSRCKLTSLEPSVGGRDKNDLLRRGVLVREALRSAWATLDSPAPASELTDWRAPDALGLSVLSEEDEEEYEEAAEERWLDDVLSDMDDVHIDADSPWAETTVSVPDADEDSMCCEFEVAHIESVELDENYDELVSVVVHVAAVDDDDSDEYEEDDVEVATAWLELPRKHSSGIVFCDDVASSSERLCQALSQLAAEPQPRARAANSFIDEVEELEELPALQRCVADEDEDDEDDEDDDCCRTPPLLSCEELEEIAEDTLWRSQPDEAHATVGPIDPDEPDCDVEDANAKALQKALENDWRLHHHAPCPSVALLLPP